MSGEEDAIDNGCIKEILHKVEKINIGNASPGTIIVYGDHAKPVLTAGKPWEIIIAAAVYGRGRIVICSHGSFCTEFMKPKKSKTFMKNLKQWLLNGKLCEETEVAILDSLKKFPVDKKIVLWKACTDKNEKFLQDLDDFLSNGGGLFVAHCPWGYLQQNPKKSLRNMAVYPILQKVGVCFSSQHASIPTDKMINIEDNKAKNVHLIECIDALLDNASDIELCCSVITKCCEYLPMDELDSLKIKLNTLISSKLEILKNILPTKKKPLKCAESKATLAMVNNIMRTLKFTDKAPGISEFPGDFETPPPLTSTDITIECKNVDVFSTGYYAPAGQIIAITAKCDVDLKSWKIRIGAHSDNLLKHLEKPLNRWPLIYIHKPLNASMEIVSNFGGLIYLVKEKTLASSTLSIRLENVVKSPFFDLKDPSAEDNWLECRDSPGLWADIVGKYITITVPSSSVRKLDNPGDIISKWDEVVCSHHELRGSNVEEHRRQWVVTDIQPSAGYMHSGYPIVTHLDVADPNSEKFLFNMNTLTKEGMWGMFHELGHNMQRPMWTFQGTNEVTCNIFSLHAMHIIANKKPWLHKWLKGKTGKAKQYFDNGADFSQWQNKNPALALFIYAQIIHEFGWEPFKVVFRSYEKLQRKPSSNQEKIDMWILKMSDAVNHNLIPLFRFWGFPISSHVEETVSFLEPFFPDDELTRLAPERKEQFLTDITVQIGPARECTTCC